MDNVKKSSIVKLVLVVFSYVLAFLYFDKLIGSYDMNQPGTFKYEIITVVVTAGFVLWLELTMLYQRLEKKVEVEKKAVIEARFWEVILIALSVATHFGVDPDLNFFLMHVVVVYMVLCGTGHLFKGESSIYIFGDLISGFFRIPFANFIVRIKTTILSVKDLITKKEGEEKSVKKTVVTLLSIAFVIVALFVFWGVFGLLSEIDSSFMTVYSGINEAVSKFFMSFIVHFEEYIFEFIVSIPIGAYLSGLYFGAGSGVNTFEKRVTTAIDGNYKRVKVIPAVIFYIISVMFVLMYTLFFVSQARLLFSGFAGVLPEEFTASRYARDGFSQLSTVLVINFMGLGVMRLFSSKSVVDSKLTLAGSVTLMATSMIFAVISASKIILYISRFGYTDLRAESLWFTVVAFAGSALAIVNMVSGKKTFKPWMIFSAVSFIVMNVIAGICQMGY